MPGDSRERSVSGDLEDSDVGSPDNGADDGSNVPAGKPGRKKNPNSQAARRDQNRIAQREFRLRKQQRIRDLEASVEILSGGKDEAITHLRKIMKDLMQENQVLRGLLRSLASFIGDGAGGVLPKMGWDLNDFDAFINRSETDTAWESYQKHKREETNGNASGSNSQKRSSEDDTNGARSKRARGDENDNERADGYPLLVPMNPAVPPVPANGLYPSASGSRSEGSLFNDLMRGSSGSPMFVPPSTNSSAQYPSPTATSVSAAARPYQSSYVPQISMNVNNSMPGLSLVNSVSLQPSRDNASSQSQTPLEEDLDPKREEAYKLIHYHLDNYKRNSQYCLPSSLRPTLVQRTVPHESVIDNILHPELRDRMILLRGRFDLVDCLHDYRRSVTIHGDDVLAHSNWEISETWLQQYKFLVDQATLKVCNHWRRERGEPELQLADYSSGETNV
ncbi:BZIP domain-containing protein [Abortiporus biennis]